MEWLAQSPDMNPLENVWKIIREKTQNRNPQNIDNLWGFLKEGWENITAIFCNKLIDSCGWRCNEVIQCKGKITKYWIFLSDLTRIYDAFLNFWPGQNVYFCFFSWLLIYCERKFRKLYICNKCIYVPSIFWENFINIQANFFK